MNKLLKNSLIVIVILLLLVLCFNLFNYVDVKNVKAKTFDKYFSLNGNNYIELKVNDEYKEDGVRINPLYFNLKVEQIGIVDTKTPGTYIIKYLAVIDKLSTVYKYRIVKIKDIEKPVIKLKGKDIVNVNLGTTYNDEGVTVTDNSHEDLTNNVNAESNVDTTKEGEYSVKYSVCDSSKNCSSITRKVIVKKVVTYTSYRAVTRVAQVEKGSESNLNIDLNKNSNTITSMTFNALGINISGYVKSGDGTYKIRLCSSNCIDYNMMAKDSHYYSGNINLTNIANGTYTMKIFSKTEMDVVNELSEFTRINRAKVGNKLITVLYINKNVKIKVEDFAYQYDILIDPGHGGYDSGAVNSHITEKELNLMQSLYEKKRYEEHGLRVKLIREDDTYGILMGSTTEANVRRRGYAIGYYGAVTKVVYSNHHNSITNNYFSGWEIIVPAKATTTELAIPLTVANYWDNNYNTTDTHTRFYTRNYDTGSILNKRNGAIYNIKNWYAIIRVSYELFNVNTTLYEGCYLSNENDFNWYYTQGNWKKITELKIKAYVEALGKTYIPI